MRPVAAYKVEQDLQLAWREEREKQPQSDLATFVSISD
jgi:hypothetical protein